MATQSPLGAAATGRLIQCIGRLYQHANLQQFPHQALHAVCDLIQADIVNYDEIGPEVETVRSVTNPALEIIQRYFPVFQKHQLDHPAIAHTFSTGDTSPRLISDFLSRADWHNRPLYQECLRLADYEDQLSFAFDRSSVGSLLAVAFNRDRRTFTEQDRTLAHLIRPHLRQAYRNARAVTRLEAEAAGTWQALEQANQPLIHVGPDGKLWHATPRARELLDAYFPRRATRSDALPADLVAELARQQEQEQANPAAPRQPLVIQRPGRTLRLRRVDQPDASQMLLLEEQVTHDPAHDARVDALPPRYRKVLQRLLAGDSEKQVAYHLGLSPHTVHTYVKKIYRHFDVSSRGELLRLWIR